MQGGKKITNQFSFSLHCRYAPEGVLVYLLTSESIRCVTVKAFIAWFVVNTSVFLFHQAYPG